MAGMASLLTILLAATSVYAALDVDLDSANSIQSAAKVVAKNLLSYYHGDEPGQIPGILPGPPDSGRGPYYWWEGGALWGTMVDYWHYTNDTTYNAITTQALVFQSENSYQPRNWTGSMGNDDKGFWAMSAMLAAEVGFPDPPPDQPQWLALAQGVFNQLAGGWETTYCAGGLRWQAVWANNGIDYKNTIPTAILFNLGARLARYTGNETYAMWAEKSWDWLVGVGYVDDEFNVYDGAHYQNNCTEINKAQFSYNAATLIEGLAYMHSFTSSESTTTPNKWQAPLTSLTNRTLTFFFPEGIIIERPCELPTTVGCNTDQLSFKGYMHRWLATSTQLAPFLAPTILAALRSSTAGAVKACTAEGTCGFRWTTGEYDGSTGAGQQMSALAALVSLLVGGEGVGKPLTGVTGGTSVGDPGAGNGHVAVVGELAPVTTGDRAGAGVVTAVLCLSLVAGVVWMAMDETVPVMKRGKGKE
ncbi:hypothetical protein C8A05DRAFT_34523 [Staphylotrichum tortipilum]|uniref:Mannan endo-1,6-alpha-mannosidase n=1 Tax=Staphylotrichum tortipilum TaxID=2831512 RepID=A0AAN6MKZ4_9PEZI|nr:hypothetical protein C8A05DRAFT_34523 [Staphylotrichum longicolle]